MRILLEKKESYEKILSYPENSNILDEELFIKYRESIANFKLLRIDIADQINKKIHYLEWLINKQALDMNPSNRQLWISKSRKLRKYLEEKSRIAIIFAELTKAKNTYLEELVKYIEIPLYIYSGKLLYIEILILIFVPNLSSVLINLTIEHPKINSLGQRKVPCSYVT